MVWKKPCNFLMELMSSAKPRAKISVMGRAMSSKIRVFLQAIQNVGSFSTQVKEDRPKPVPVLVM